MNRQLELERIQLIKESLEFFKEFARHNVRGYLEEVCSAEVPDIRFRKAELKRINENELRTLDFIENYPGDHFPESVKKYLKHSLAVMSGYRDF